MNSFDLVSELELVSNLSVTTYIDHKDLQIAHISLTTGYNIDIHLYQNKFYLSISPKSYDFTPEKSFRLINDKPIQIKTLIYKSRTKIIEGETLFTFKETFPIIYLDKESVETYFGNRTKMQEVLLKSSLFQPQTFFLSSSFKENGLFLLSFLTKQYEKNRFYSHFIKTHKTLHSDELVPISSDGIIQETESEEENNKYDLEIFNQLMLFVLSIKPNGKIPSNKQIQKLCDSFLNLIFTIQSFPLLKNQFLLISSFFLDFLKHTPYCLLASAYASIIQETFVLEEEEHLFTSQIEEQTSAEETESEFTDSDSYDDFNSVFQKSPFGSNSSFSNPFSNASESSSDTFLSPPNLFNQLIKTSQGPDKRTYPNSYQATTTSNNNNNKSAPSINIKIESNPTFPKNPLTITIPKPEIKSQNSTQTSSIKIETAGSKIPAITKHDSNQKLEITTPQNQQEQNTDNKLQGSIDAPIPIIEIDENQQDENENKEDEIEESHTMFIDPLLYSLDISSSSYSFDNNSIKMLQEMAPHCTIKGLFYSYHPYFHNTFVRLFEFLSKFEKDGNKIDYTKIVLERISQAKQLKLDKIASFLDFSRPFIRVEKINSEKYEEIQCLKSPFLRKKIIDYISFIPPPEFTPLPISDSPIENMFITLSFSNDYTKTFPDIIIPSKLLEDNQEKLEVNKEKEEVIIEKQEEEEEEEENEEETSDEDDVTQNKQTKIDIVSDENEENDLPSTKTSTNKISEDSSSDVDIV